ncbi:MAG: hypothetical protein K9M97_05955 [Akkermansiaceae bacterium]|nr:hypothetical protein [Akkermansiaceae bacterium]
MRIPLAGEPTGLLVMERPEEAGAKPGSQTAGGGGHPRGDGDGDGDGEMRRHRVRKRRNAASGDGEGPSWEHGTSGAHRSGRSERRRMRWMLTGGIALFVAMVVGLVLAFKNSGDDHIVSAGDGGETQPAKEEPPAAAAAGIELPALMKRSEAELLVEAEPLARKFLEARTAAELLEVVSHPERVAARMRREYPDGKVVPPGMVEFAAGQGVAYAGAAATINVRTTDYELRQLDFVESAEGLKISWESWVGWCEMSWTEFLEQRPTEPQLCRVVMRKVDYYNFDFTDDSRWRSYQLESVDGKWKVYGYVERDSVLDGRLQMDPDASAVLRILKLRFPDDPAGRGKQVLISEFATDGWVEPDAGQS